VAVAKDRFDDFEMRESVREGIKRELDTLDILLWAKVSRSSISLEEYIKLRTIQGASMEIIREDLLTDLNEGGRIFGEFRRALKPTFAGSVNRFRDVGEMAETGISTTWRWSAVLINTCPDCLDRHGQVKKWNEWEEEGLPRTGATVCKENCKCVLLPAQATALEPIFRGDN
jgi:hypothetical protein